MKAYKGFDKDFKCRDFQFEIGKSYTHDGEVKICNSGFHACTNPIDVFGYYGPGNSKFAEVEINGDIKDEKSDSKICGKNISIKAEISLSDFIKTFGGIY